MKNNIKHIKSAFDSIEKIYLDISYLIKDVEGMLAEEEENFVIGKLAGPAISARSARGLEKTDIPLWMIRKLAVFYIPKGSTKTREGRTYTKFGKTLKLIYLRVVLNEKNMKDPYLYAGVLYDVTKKNHPNQWPSKFENVMGHFEYNEGKIFRNLGAIRYEDGYIKLKGKLVRVNLSAINSSDDIQKKIIKPALKVFRGI